MWKVLRRLFWLALLAGAGYGVYATWQRKHEPQPDGPPEWPPLDDAATPAPPVSPAETAADDVGAVAGFADVGAAEASVVSANGDGTTSDRRWVEPVDGECPPGYPIKGNDNSGIYHVPGGRFYDRTVPERCYATEADAEADGYRRAKA